MIGSPLKAAGFSESRGLWLMDVRRGDRSRRSSIDTVELVAGDRIVVRSKMGDMLGLREAGDVALGRPELHAFEPIAAQETVRMEGVVGPQRSEEHTSELQSLMRRSYAVFCLKKKSITREKKNIKCTYHSDRV